MPTNLIKLEQVPLQPGDMAVQKVEHDINQNINRIADSIEQLTDKLDRPIQKVYLARRAVQMIPWGLIGVGAFFTLGYLTMKNRRNSAI